MTESNLKEMMIDDINEEAEEETTATENQPKLKWYLIDKEKTFCKVWNFMITIIIIYSLFVTPYIFVFPEVFEWCTVTTTTGSGANTVSTKTVYDYRDTWKVNGEDVYRCSSSDSDVDGKYSHGKDSTLYEIDLIFDIIFFIEIILNFVKRSRAHRELKQIANNYLLGYFLFDVVGTLPCLFMNESIHFYYLKLFRIVHVTRLN